MTIDEKIASKQITKEILIEMLNHKCFRFVTAKEIENAIPTITAAYETIYKKVSEL